MSGTELELVNYAVGFDLGHGDTALMAVNLKSEQTKDRAFKVEIDGKATFVTALADHPRQGILIGEQALTTEGVAESWISFKRRPDSGPQYRKVIETFAQYICKRLMASRHGFSNDNTYFYVGCPTVWALDANVIATYQALFNKAGFRHVKVVPESRAALMNGIESGDILASVGDLRGRALIIDLGSSTTDVTLIDLEQRRAEPFDFGDDLGGALIDKLIFRDTLITHKRSAELTDIFLQSPTMRNRCEFLCREVKEAWFNNPRSTPSRALSVVLDDLYFNIKLDETKMQRLLQQPLTVLEDMGPLFGASLPHLPQSTWPEAFETLLNKAKKSGGNTDIVYAAGGASRMNFVEPLCTKVFPKAKYVGSKEPEYAIAVGLAYWGRLDIGTMSFMRAVEEFAEQKIRPEVVNNIGTLYDALAANIANEAVTIAKSEFDGWKSRRHLTLNAMKNDVQRQITKWMAGEGKTVVRTIVEQLASKVGSSLTTQIKKLESKYGLPIGSLGGSFSLDAEIRLEATVGRIEPRSLTQDISDNIGVTVGIIAGVVTAIIMAILVYILTTLIVPFILNPLTLAAIVATGLIAKAQASHKMEEVLAELDLPAGVRKLVIADYLYKKLDSCHGEIKAKVLAELKNNNDLSVTIINSMSQALKASLTKKADDARLLIS